jgi:hypothetical protein
MSRAQQQHVVEVGSAALFPFVDVVGLAAGRVDAAAGCGAVLVADLECSAESRWCGAVGASDVEHLPPTFPNHVRQSAWSRVAVVGAAGGVGGTGEDTGEVGVAEDPRDRRRGKQCLADAGEAKRPAEAVDEVVDVDGEGYVGTLRMLGPDRPGVEAAAGQVGQCQRVEVVAAVFAAQVVGALLAGGLVLRPE